MKKLAYLASLAVIASLVLAPTAMANPFAEMDDATRQTVGLIIGVCIILASGAGLHFSNKHFKNAKNQKSSKKYKKNLKGTSNKKRK